jgi:hypothetical protein
MSSTYDQLLSSARNQKELYDASAKDYIPQMCKALEKENPSLTKEDIRDRIKKDCVQLWGLRWIIYCLPEDYKDKVKQQNVKNKDIDKSDAVVHQKVTDKSTSDLANKIRRGVIEVAEKIGAVDHEAMDEFDDEETEIIRKAEKIKETTPWPTPETELGKQNAEDLGLSEPEAPSLTGDIIRQKIEAERRAEILKEENDQNRLKIDDLFGQIKELTAALNQALAAQKFEESPLYTSMAEKIKELEDIALGKIREGGFVNASQMSTTSTTPSPTASGVVKFDGTKLFGAIFKYRENVLELVHNGAEVTEVRLPK